MLPQVDLVFPHQLISLRHFNTDILKRPAEYGQSLTETLSSKDAARVCQVDSSCRPSQYLYREATHVQPISVCLSEVRFSWHLTGSPPFPLWDVLSFHIWPFRLSTFPWLSSVPVFTVGCYNKSLYCPFLAFSGLPPDGKSSGGKFGSWVGATTHNILPAPHGWSWPALIHP